MDDRQNDTARLFRSVKPSDSDLEKARTLTRDACPRRYRWWWQSLGFDWELTPQQGCAFQKSEKPPGWKHVDQPCSRCDPASAVDHYEPREPHLLADGFAIDRWSKHESL